jgi:hypothetical protein
VSGIWIVLGSSPLARTAYQQAKARNDGVAVITANRGLQIEHDPDFYFLSDSKACELWAEDGRQATKRGRTKTVTLRRDPHAMRERKVADFTLLVKEGPPFEPFQLSGLWCVEFAVQVGHASQVILCGMDGYDRSKGVGDYFAGSTRIPEFEGAGKDLTDSVVEPLTNRIVSKYPGVNFQCWGQPCYVVNRPNWVIIPLSL